MNDLDRMMNTAADALGRHAATGRKDIRTLDMLRQLEVYCLSVEHRGLFACVKAEIRWNSG
jgi:hypothetical protein